MSNIFDTAGLQAVLNVEAESMITRFDEANEGFIQLNPAQILVSKDFLQRLIDQMDEKDRNCVRMRLGRNLLPGGETRLAWMMQTVQAHRENENENIKLSKRGPWFSSASGAIQQTEPPGAGEPPFDVEQ